MKSENRRFDPMSKRYEDMKPADKNYVRLEAETVAERILTQNHGRGAFFFRLLANHITARAKEMEPQAQESADTI